MQVYARDRHATRSVSAVAVEASHHSASSSAVIARAVESTWQSKEEWVRGDWKDDTGLAEKGYIPPRVMSRGGRKRVLHALVSMLLNPSTLGKTLLKYI